MSQTEVFIHHELVDKCKRGEPRAQRELYNHYSKAMFNVALRIVNDHFEAEDLVQECFVTAFTRIQTFRGDSSFGAWLKRIVVNRSINTVKRRKACFDPIDDNVHGDHYEKEEEEEQQWGKFTVQDVKMAIGHLPEGYRIVFSLYMFEDFSHKEIADQLDITESTSKSQLNRAKKKLKELLILQR
ncbi:MAG: RNA polymerase sigma factor (sigma-70 family) [Flavobacteriales bacterium]